MRLIISVFATEPHWTEAVVANPTGFRQHMVWVSKWICMSTTEKPEILYFPSEFIKVAITINEK